MKSGWFLRPSDFKKRSIYMLNHIPCEREQISKETSENDQNRLWKQKLENGFWKVWPWASQTEMSARMEFTYWYNRLNNSNIIFRLSYPLAGKQEEGLQGWNKWRRLHRCLKQSYNSLLKRTALTLLINRDICKKGPRTLSHEIAQLGSSHETFHLE